MYLVPEIPGNDCLEDCVRICTLYQKLLEIYWNFVFVIC